MTFPKRRDRVVLFRLTQEEYRGLIDASAERGARNLSDFARSELLNALEEPALKGRLTTVEQRLTDIHSTMERMQSLLETIADGKKGES